MPMTAVRGSADRWGPLWGARPADWALSEDQQFPTYEDALSRVGLEPEQLVLDVGCGVGSFLRLVADRGARACGIDASEALLDVARTRLPDADLRVGDMEALPYDDDTFDLVTGFNSFFFANDIVAALREAPTTQSRACSRTSPPRPASSPRAHLTPPGPTSTRTRTPSAARSSRPRGLPFSSAPTAKTRSRTPSSAALSRTAPMTGDTGCATPSTP